MDRIDAGHAAVDPPSCDDDEGARPRESFGQRAAEDTRPADDHGGPAREPEQLLDVSVRHAALRGIQVTGLRRSSHSV